ncbi:MAG: alanine dehydrogenase/PNT protein [Solirubrobacterales bacterium]|nr:alanine dehydrogenase/PNT protein [Solirubrobacterales bacterium]
MHSLGVIATSRKPDERRLPIHPGHLERLAADVRGQMTLEEGYGEPFGWSDERIAPLVGGLAPRDEVLTGSDVVVLPKPQHADVAAMHEGQVLWGWPHCVQDAELTQLAIDRRLTLIAWEAMNHWKTSGAFDVHVFHKNNELAGYSSVLHALSLRGRSGAFGPRVSAAVISFGATGRGAVHGLSALGVNDVTVLTQRAASAVASPITSVRIETFDPDVPLAPVLAKFDIVVNCIFQDPEDPLIFVRDQDLPLFAPGTLFVDVSCDEGMGFEWASPTSFAEPMVVVGDRCHYYAVDHSPSFLYNSATWEISEALRPYIAPVLTGPSAWDADETLRRAIEIRDGVVQNPKILAFQGRSAEYPHPVQ